MKYVSQFHEGSAADRERLGGKGAGLAEMTRLGLPVPQGFTVSTEACRAWMAGDGSLPPGLEEELDSALRRLESETGRRLGDGERPLLLSVRSGARVSMPGMMDTILDLGLSRETARRMGERSGKPRWAWDCFRRLIQMYADVVMGADPGGFEALLAAKRKARGTETDTGLTAEDLKTLCGEFLEEYARQLGSPFPEEPREQLLGAVKAVFRSWLSPRAKSYRRLKGIPGDWGTAVNVQRMVFGNLGEDSGSGVAFTRDPATGTKGLFGEFLPNAQGEDVVAGIRDPLPLSALAAVRPELYRRLEAVGEKLEAHYRDVQDMEFTVEEGELFMLQTRAAQRSPEAAVKIACDLAEEGRITRREALLRLDPEQAGALLLPRFDPGAMEGAVLLGRGLAASPGAGAGKVCFTAARAKELAKAGPVILVRRETATEDIEGMAAARGILTATGGRTSHAAVVARGMGRCCVCGCGELQVDEAAGTLRLGGRTLREGDSLSLDGSTGCVYLGALPTREAALSPEFRRLLAWADEYRRLGVRANADTPADAARALELGAEGVGLVRTEHMFFAPDRLPLMRRMILAENGEERAAALADLLPLQREDFLGIWRVMGEKPVTIRLLDPPLHEFLPPPGEERAALARAMGLSGAELDRRVEALREQNPMLGHRGCRLAVTFPEIAAMQTRAALEAALLYREESGLVPTPELMVPLVSGREELAFTAGIIREEAARVFRERGGELELRIGAMVELPRAALLADKLAEEAEFFSFGTNDLTQTAFGLSRDDAARFLPAYYERGILPHDPFRQLDEAGVGKLVELGAELGRKARPGLKLGVCGEHGGDGESIRFFHRMGLDYVSCSPYRVPVARLAAARAALEE